MPPVFAARGALAAGPVPFIIGLGKLGVGSPGPMLALRGAGLGSVGTDMLKV